MNRVKTLLNIEFPIIQAPMAGVQDSELAIAVSNSGALGSVPCSMLSLEKLEHELSNIQKKTDKPINFNFFCHTIPNPDNIAQQRWQQVLASFTNEYQVDPTTILHEATRRPFTQEHLDVLSQFKPKIISFHFGLPDTSLVEQLKSWGTTILSTATTLEEAINLEQNGADIIIAQGIEAGGHRGMFLTKDLDTQLATMVLTPQLAEAVKIPIIAAGGIATSQSIKAAMVLGASGVQIGTSYLLCHEAKTSPLHRQALQAKHKNHTVITNIFTGKPARGIVTRVIREIGPISLDAPNFPYAAPLMQTLRKAAESKGDNYFTPMWAGQNMMGCSEISAAELTQELTKAFN